MGSGDGDLNHALSFEYPSHPCATHKIQAGWLEPTVIKNDQSLQIQEIETNAKALKLWENGEPKNEYFVLENRNVPNGNDYDSGLPSSGLLIWHVDSTRINNGNNQGVALEQADDQGPDGVGNSGDPFSRNTNSDFLPVNSSPNSMSNNEEITGVAVANISDPGPVMSAEITVSHFPTYLEVSASPQGILSNYPSISTISASLFDEWQELVRSATNPLTFTITSGSSSGNLIGINPVNAVNGMATIQLESTQTPGVVTIEASSPGLTPATINVTVAENTVWHVATTGDNEMGTGQPDRPFATIQKGIDEAASGNVILVSPGTYFECINFKGKSVVVASHFLVTQDESFISNTILDGSQALTDSSVVYIVNGEDDQTELVGFTIQNGRGSYVSYPNHHGGGISIHKGARPTIQHCRIKNNTSSYQGGGIFCRLATPLLKFCTIYGNSAIDAGGVIFIDTSPKVENCTIVYNSVSDRGGGIFNHNSSTTIVNSIVWANQAPTGSQFRNQRGSNPNISYSDIQGGWSGVGNIEKDPLFCDVDSNDYRLLPVLVLVIMVLTLDPKKSVANPNLLSCQRQVHRTHSRNNFLFIKITRILLIH